MQKVRKLPLLLVSGVLLFLSTWGMAEEGFFSPPTLPQPKAGAEQCVETVENMRREHMMMIKHQRDDTMHRGIRTTKYSLVGCINCHVVADEQGNYPSAKSDQHFCTNCHAYAAVQIDCFQCHASKPEGAAGHE